MKVWVVIGNNGESYEDYSCWTDAVCATKEAAERWISERKEMYYRDEKRDDELQMLRCERELTDAEAAELRMIQERNWNIYCISKAGFNIFEYDLFE